MPTELRAKKTRSARSWPVIAPGDPDLIATVLFCVIVLLFMLVVILSFPGFGAVIEQYHGIWLLAWAGSADVLDSPGRWKAARWRPSGTTGEPADLIISGPENWHQMKLVAQYRQFAEECRKLAVTTDKRGGKQMLQSMARAWERVANERERQLRKQIDICSGFDVLPDKGASSVTHP